MSAVNSKIKQWSVSVLGEKKLNQTINVPFWTPDTGAVLIFKLTDSNLQPESATVTMLNKDDGSTVSEQWDVVDNELTFPLTNEDRNIAQHPGHWDVQLVYENNKDYATQWISFKIGGSVIGDKEPKLELIESYRVLEKQMLDFMKRYDERLDNIITTPADGVSAQEIIDARVGENSLGVKIRHMDDERERVENKADRKHAELNKELTTHKQATSNLNVNQEARQTAEGRRVVSLPETAGEGHGEFGLQGLTATNLIENGDFRDGIAGWESYFASEITMDGGNLKVSRADSATSGAVYDTTSKANTVYYVFTTVELTDDLSSEVFIRVQRDAEGRASFTKVKKGVNTLSFNFKTNSIAEDGIRLMVVNKYENATIAEGKYFYIHKLQLINLTDTFGAGNEPSKEECDRIFANYFEGTQSVNGNVRVTSGESALYIDAPKLRNLPNGIYDEIQGDELIQRVSDTGGVLAEPIITPLSTSGNLITQPSGTVYIEDVIADVATYTDKISVEQSLKELDQLSVVDYETGVEQELDIKYAVIAEDRLSFTHPDLATGDIVFFEYYLDVESTDGLASVEYYDSRYTIQDSVTDKIYKWNIKVADGVPSIELEEV